MKMLLSQNASAIRPLNLYLLVYISLAFGTVQAFSGDTCILRMTLRNFRAILSWELKNHSIVPTHYTLWYTIMSRPEDKKVVKDCANITRSFCDLTDVWEKMSETYIPTIVGFQGNTTLVSCLGNVFPATNMSLEPPEFEIVGFTDHINVIVKFPPVIPKMLHEEGLQLSLVIKDSGGIVQKHEQKINANITENFTYVINNLIPNTNYCVSAYLEPKNTRKISEYPAKCILLRPRQESESSESAKIGVLITLFLIVTVFLSTGVTLKRTGYICLRIKFPKVLSFSNRPAWVLPELPPLEAVAVLEVIHINRKKKVWDYNYDDESDSDNEAAPRTSAGGYTMHGLTGRPLGPACTSSATLQDCSDRDTEEADLPEAETEAESLLAAGPGPWTSERTSHGAYEGRGAPLADPLSEDDSSSTEGAEDRIIFNVDLNSVLVRVLDDDDDDSEVPPVLSLPEETLKLEDPDKSATSLPLGSGGETQLPLLPPSVECLWPEDSPSEKSDTSKSDDDIRDGYLMR